MANQRVLQTNFTGGQFDERLIGRIDLDKYGKSVSIAKNVIAFPQGGLAKRAGTEYVASLSTGVKKLIRFEFNVTQTYLLVLEAGKLYFYRDGVLITNINSTGNDYLVVPYTADQIPLTDYVQSADTLFITHEDVAVRTITRGSAHNLWTLATFAGNPTYDFSSIGSGVNYNGFTLTVTNAGDFGTQTLTSSDDVFTAAHVGGVFRTSQGFARITARADAKTVTLDVIKDLDPGATSGVSFSGAASRIEEPAFTAVHGYPKTVTFHEGRLWFGGSKTLPQSMWGSVVRDFTNFEIGESFDDESIQITLDTDQVNAITHLVSGQHLQIFTTGGEFYIRTTSGGPITPSDFSAKVVDTYGAKAGIKPVRVETQTLFVDYDSRAIRSFIFELTRDNYSSDLTTLLAPMVINNPVDMDNFTNFGVQEGNYVIVVNTDGTMAVLNLMPTEKILSWTTFEMTEGVKATHIREVEDVIYLVLTGVTPGEDTLVKFNTDIYTDASIVLENTSSVVTGLTHLNGQLVSIVADGEVLQSQTVSGGQLTIGKSATKLNIGISFEVEVETLPISPPDRLGGESVEVKRVNYVELMMTEESLGVIVNGDRIPDRTFGSNLNEPAMNGTIYRGTPLLGWGRIVRVTITQTDPLPFIMLTLTCQVSI